MSKLSIVISAYNEERKLPACLESVKDFADEIIVVDNTSLDKTNEIAKKYTKHVFKRENNLMLNVNKNYGFEQATGDWILCLDADERITHELAHEVRKMIEEYNNYNGYWIPRKNIIFGKWIQNSIWWPDYQLRLFKKAKGRFPEKHIHEMIELDGETGHLHEPMIHENYESISQYLYKLDKIYTENEVKNFLDSGKKIIWLDALRFPAKDFVSTFFARKGFKDGLHGLVLSLLQAFYAEVVFAKLWEQQGFYEYNNSTFLSQVTAELKHIANEFHYWLFTASLESTKNPIKKMTLKIKRKLSQANSNS